MQPRVNVLWPFFIVETPVPWRRLLFSSRIVGNRENRDSRANKLEEIAPRQFELMHGSGGELVAFRFKDEFSAWLAHRPCSCIILAAWRTATAHIALQELNNLRPTGVWIRLQQADAAHDHS